MNYPNYVKVIIDRLTDAGYEAYVVGGSLRDMLIGREPSDFDVTTSALPERILEIFSDMRTIPTGLQHGTVTVMSEGEPIEVTTFRTDGEYLDSRHPESVSFTSDICSDLARRDFTVNAIAYNNKRGLVDPFGGENDIKRCLLRAVGDPDTRMREDALRIMRALRFSAQLGFSIVEETLLSLGRTKEGLASISRERIGIETSKLVTSPFPYEPLFIMINSGISKYVLGDYIPSKKSIDCLPRLENDFALRFAALLWDCETASAREILSSLKYSNAQKSSVLSILSSRSYPLPTSEADIRRFIVTFKNESENAARLLCMLGGAPDSFFDEIKSVNKTDFPRKISDLKINGNDLICLGIGGKEIGKTLESLFEMSVCDPQINNREKLIEIIKNKDY